MHILLKHCRLVWHTGLYTKDETSVTTMENVSWLNILSLLQFETCATSLKSNPFWVILQITHQLDNKSKLYWTNLRVENSSFLWFKKKIFIYILIWKLFITVLSTFPSFNYNILDIKYCFIYITALGSQIFVNINIIFNIFPSSLYTH